MANRHLARSVVLQTLFEWDTTHASEADTPAILARNVAERLERLNQLLERALEDWPR